MELWEEKSRNIYNEIKKSDFDKELKILDEREIASLRLREHLSTIGLS